MTLDFDSDYVFSRSRRRQGADRTYNKGYALHSAVVFRRPDGSGRARPTAPWQGRRLHRHLHV